MSEEKSIMQQAAELANKQMILGHLFAMRPLDELIGQGDKFDIPELTQSIAIEFIFEGRKYRGTVYPVEGEQ